MLSMAVLVIPGEHYMDALFVNSFGSISAIWEQGLRLLTSIGTSRSEKFKWRRGLAPWSKDGLSITAVKGEGELSREKSYRR